ncbi:hypothetical protein [Parvicella tangerina]|uniref:Uncharacterized protein n=1 Tax=Parvicella tangerina TaxID=2829795 RepID=A0A916N9D7_9FLAO|nr:hypothetical protein [Parvicella tangerina]CAG5076924.1 hypothetical protein CRYO30217_00245 [Parvicella tangerina]
MLRLANILSVIVVIATSALAFFHYHDDMDIKIPYLSQMFIGAAVLLGMVLLIKLTSRWPAVLMALKTEGYKLSLKGFRKVIIYEGMVLLYLGVFAYVMLSYIDIGFWTGIVASVLFLEGAILLLTQLVKSPFKVLLNDKAITKITNEWEVVSWNDIKKIDSRQNDIHLIRKNGTPVLIDLEWIEKSVRDDFIARINRIAQEKGIYCSIDCVGEYQDFAKMSSQPIYNE